MNFPDGPPVVSLEIDDLAEELWFITLRASLGEQSPEWIRMRLAIPGAADRTVTELRRMCLLKAQEIIAELLNAPPG